MNLQDQMAQLRERKRMELFNTIYTQNASLIPQYSGNIAELRADEALRVFDETFPKPEPETSL